MRTVVADPLYFGPVDGELFGWLHRAPDSAATGVGLVVCNPFGFEEVCAHRGMRQLADAVAAAGVPTLRFDYAGCGNSAGDEFAPDTWQRWLRSVHCAIDGLKQATGVRTVCLLGTRLGAALATLAAVERDDIAGLAAIAPVVRGRAYLRELTVLEQTGRGAAMPTSAPAAMGFVESAGFVLTRETAEALEAVDLRKLARSPAPRVLIVPRDDIPGGAEWTAYLQTLGAVVTRGDWSGYAQMMDDPQRATTPLEIVDGVRTWLDAVASTAPARAASAATWGRPSLRTLGTVAEGTVELEERATHVAASDSRLFAVLTRRLPPAKSAPPAVLMLNSGSVHAIGPNRLWVRLARQWAARGIVVMRLDIGGIGDSDTHEGAADNVVYSRHATADVAAALAHLRQHEGIGECHVMGLCSGAYHALKAAVAGQQMASALMINPLTFFWKEGTKLSDIHDYEVFELAQRYRGKVFTRESWQRFLRGDLNLRMIGEVVWRRVAHVVSPWMLELARATRLPMHNDLARELDAVLRRGIELRFVFGSQATGFELLQRQAGRALARVLERRTASIDFVPESDHTFTRAEARERLVALLDRLMLARCGVAAGPA